MINTLSTINAMSLAVAISLYNRWDELQGLLELLRVNWQTGKNLHIIVSSTADQAEVPDWIEQSYVDDWIFGSTYTLPAKKSSWFQPLHDRRYGEFKRRLRARTVDCISRVCARAARSGRSYTLHLHAAAWPLNEKFIYKTLRHMSDEQFIAAGRGFGQDLVDGKHPAGDVDDNFFIIENQFAWQNDFWKIDPLLDAEIMGAEGKIGRRLLELGVQAKLYYYDDFSRPEEYIFPPGTTQRRIQPYNYHKPTGLLRSHDLRMQARYCRQFGFRGPWLDEMIARELDIAPSQAVKLTKA